jgi:hypothetical protein
MSTIKIPITIIKKDGNKVIVSQNDKNEDVADWSALLLTIILFLETAGLFSKRCSLRNLMLNRIVPTMYKMTPRAITIHP